MRLRAVGLWVATATVAIVLVLVAWQLYSVADKPLADFQQKLADLSLQLALVVVVGGSIKALFDRHKEQRQAAAEELAERGQKKREFARRMRDVHVTVEAARKLLRAHQSPKTWSEQHRALMRRRFELEDLHADLSAAVGLFAGQQAILTAIDGVLEFLASAEAEYERAHQHVSSDWPARTLDEIIKQRQMTWTRDFLDGTGAYELYVQRLVDSKGAMRAEAYGV